MVLWWVPRDHRPTVEEAIERLEALRRHGPHRRAFNFRALFPPPDAPAEQGVRSFGDRCPAS